MTKDKLFEIIQRNFLYLLSPDMNSIINFECCAPIADQKEQLKYWNRGFCIWTDYFNAETADQKREAIIALAKYLEDLPQDNPRLYWVRNCGASTSIMVAELIWLCSKFLSSEV